MGGSEESPTIFAKLGLADEGMTSGWYPRTDPQNPKAPALPLVQAIARHCKVLAPARAHPLHLVTIGDHALLTVPGEPTTATAWTLEREIGPQLEARATMVLGYAGDYVGYFTSPAEYRAQHYEGGMTLFGRLQSRHLRLRYAAMAEDLPTAAPALAAPDVAPASDVVPAPSTLSVAHTRAPSGIRRGRLLVLDLTSVVVAARTTLPATATDVSGSDHGLVFTVERDAVSGASWGQCWLTPAVAAGPLELRLDGASLDVVAIEGAAPVSDDADGKALSAFEGVAIDPIPRLDAATRARLRAELARDRAAMTADIGDFLGRDALDADALEAALADAPPERLGGLGLVEVSGVDPLTDSTFPGATATSTARW